MEFEYIENVGVVCFEGVIGQPMWRPRSPTMAINP